jgi:hypothetical protein
MKKFLLILILCAVSSISSAEDVMYTAAPAALPGVSVEMQNAGFWIARHPYPDKTILLSSEVMDFNQRTQADGLITDLVNFPETLSGKDVRFEIERLIAGLRGRSLYDKNGKSAGVEFYVPLFSWMFSGLGEKAREVRYGFVTGAANERLLPTMDPLYAKPGDVDFDELQNSGPAMGEPVLVLHATPDGEWLFVKDRIASGWVLARDIALSSRGDFLKQIARRASSPGVVVSLRAPVYLDESMRMFLGTARMGTVFALKGSGAKAMEVAVPRRDQDGSVRFATAFIAREDVLVGFLPFTPRVILTQAFKVLHAPYGWGDMNGGQDCSRFLQMVFASVGIDMPRNSGEQARVGIKLGAFTGDASLNDKADFLHQKAVGALTLLRLKGHIMLYLGEVNRMPYVIHSTWSYREQTSQGERPRYIGRVALTGLDLGGNSSKGSLMKRIIDVRLMTLSSSSAVLK